MKTYFLHNRRCSKSRETLEILEKSWKKYILVEYLKSPLDLEQLKDIFEIIGWDVNALIRDNEKEYKDLGLSKKSTSLEILKAISRFPNLMQRPIFIDEKKWVICRPPEKILEFL